MEQVYRLMEFGKVEPMSEIITRLYITMYMLDQRNEEPEGIDHWIYQAAEKRAQALPIDFSKPVIILLTAQAGTIGSINLYLHYLNWQAEQKEVATVNMDFLVKVLPNGFYTENAMRRFWDAQKGNEGQNLIDVELGQILKQEAKASA